MADPTVNVNITTRADTAQLDAARKKVADLQREVSEEAARQRQLRGADAQAAQRELEELTRRLREAEAEERRLSEATRQASASTQQQTTAAQQGTRTIASMENELRQLRAQLRGMDVDSDAFRTTRERAELLSNELGTLRVHQDNGARSGANFGQAMLQGSRGVQDFAAAGVPGVVNNLESLASALGLGAGAAGAVTLVAVAVDMLVRNGDKLGSLFGGPEKAKEFWSAISPEEAAVKRMQDAATALERQADAIERTTKARIDEIDATAKQEELRKKEKDLWKDVIPKDQQPIGDALPNLPGFGALSPEHKTAAETQAKAEAAFQGKTAQFNLADDAYAKQKQLVEDMNALASMKAKNELQNKADNETLFQLDTAEMGPNGPTEGEAKLRAEVEARIAARNKAMQDGLAKLNVPGLTDGLTGNAEEDEAKLKAFAEAQRGRLAELEQQRYKAAVDYKSAHTDLSTAQKATRDQADFDIQKAHASVMKDKGGLPMPGQFRGADDLMNWPQLPKLGEPPVQAPMRPVTQEAGQTQADEAGAAPETAAPPAVSGDEVKRTRAGLVNMANAAGNAPGNEEYRRGLGALDAAVSDGKGDTGAEMEVLQRMRDNIAKGQSRAQAVLEALRGMDALQEGSQDMSQKLASAFASMAQTMKSIAQMAESTRADFETYRSTNR